jgi:hypothetical protein
LHDDPGKHGGSVLAKGDESAFAGPKAGEGVRQHRERAIGGSKTMKKKLAEMCRKRKMPKTNPKWEIPV